MESDAPLFRCYSVRRLNPFLGVVQIVASPDSRALSLDGHHWEIQIRAEIPSDTWGGLNTTDPSRRFLRFGIWSLNAGLKKIPANPLLDLTSMITAMEQLLSVLEAKCEDLPFLLADRFEYWLLDQDDQSPLALLASAIDMNQALTPASLRWKCGNRSEGDFDSPEMDMQEPPHPADTDPQPHMSSLERLVRIRSGRAGAKWFERDERGGGKRLEPSPTDSPRFSASAFPELLLKESWDVPHHQSLAADYLAWLSPHLLMLQNLSDITRHRLEAAALKRALLVDEGWRLYPRIVDPGIIQTARVEARLRRKKG